MKCLRNQLVAAAFCHKNFSIGRIALDLLAQPVDVGFQRVRGDAGIVAPHFLQQRLARYRPLAGAVEIAKDRRLLFGEADLVALGVEQKLRTRPERIGADGEDRVLAGFMLTKLAGIRARSTAKRNGLVT